MALADKRHLKRIIRKGLEVLTGAAHQYLADDEEKARGMYVAEDVELEDSSDHLASIGARHGMAASNDVADAVQAGVVVAAYLIRQFRIRGQLRRDRAAVAAFAPPDEPPGQQ